MVLTVSEIVSSLQGEGKHTGLPTTFVRLYGCNILCMYCDTMYAVVRGKRKRLSIDTILTCIFRMKNTHVCLTGGEPLIQEGVYPLIYELVSRGYVVNIETNGTVSIPASVDHRSFTYCMDVKCLSSGESRKNNLANMDRLLSQDEVKFVISDRADYDFAKSVLKEYPTKASILFSPCFIDGKHNGHELSQWILEDKIYRARLGVQLHKVVGIY